MPRDHLLPLCFFAGVLHFGRHPPCRKGSRDRAAFTLKRRSENEKKSLQSLFKTLAEAIRYGSDTLKRDLCLRICRKENNEVLGALLCENYDTVNSVLILLNAIANVGPVAVLICNQVMPISSIRNLSEMIRQKRTRYRTSRWIATIIREDPEEVGKQILLRPDIMSALAEGISNDRGFLLSEVGFSLVASE